MTDPSDPTLPENEAPSRSHRRREALGMLALAEQLATMAAATLARLEVPEDVREEAARVRTITAHGARKRELAYLAKLMRRHDDEAFAPLRAVVGNDRAQRERDAAAFRRVEALRDRLLDGDTNALTSFIQRCPRVDRQRLNALIRQARAERERARPPRAARELFRMLRELHVE